jgi:predicted HTH domain antitoxin
MPQVSVSYPVSLPDVLQESPEQFEQEARMAMAVKLFELKRVSSGIAAAMAGCDRVSFLLRLHEFGVPMIDLTAADIAEDAANA